MPALVSGVYRLGSYGVTPPCSSLLRSYSLDIGILFCLAGFGLQLGRFSLLVVFLRVLGIIAYPALVDCLFRSHHQDAAGDEMISASAFSLRKNAFMQN